MWHLIRNGAIVESRETLTDTPWAGMAQLPLRSARELEVHGIVEGTPGRVPFGVDPDAEQLELAPRYDARAGVVVEDFARRPWPPRVALMLRCKTILTATQWTVLADSPLLAAGKAAWTTYRAAIRALPNNTPDPTNVTWPTPPPTRGELD